MVESLHVPSASASASVIPSDAIVEEEVEIGGLRLTVVHPSDPDELIDEEAFEHEEFLPYWAELWPSALALGRVLERRELGGLRVLELGCGLAVPSIVAALRGAEVLATDWAPDAIGFAHRNAEVNGARVEIELAAWADVKRLEVRGPWQLVLASDVLYERRNVELLIDVLSRLGAAETLLADPGRPALAAFLDGARARWHVEELRDAELPRGGVYSLSAR